MLSLSNTSTHTRAHHTIAYKNRNWKFSSYLICTEYILIDIHVLCIWCKKFELLCMCMQVYKSSFFYAIVFEMQTLLDLEKKKHDVDTKLILTLQVRFD
jgi:hypothetical protein